MAEHARLFMHLTGAETGMIKGESTVVGRGGWIDIDDWSWSMKRNSRSAGSETVEPTKLTFTKLMDRSTATMLGAMNGGSLMNATIKMDDSNLEAFKLEVQIKNLRIVGYKFDVKLADDNTAIEEDWEFDYEAVVFEYRPDATSGAMKVRIERPPGATMGNTPDEKLSKFLELSRDMSVQDLGTFWEKLKPEHKKQYDLLESAKKIDGAKKPAAK